MWFSYRTDDMLKYMFWMSWVVSSILKLCQWCNCKLKCVWSMIWIMFNCLLRLGIKCMNLMPAAVGNLSYANCLRKWHVKPFMFYEESMW